MRNLLRGKYAVVKPHVRYLARCLVTKSVDMVRLVVFEATGLDLLPIAVERYLLIIPGYDQVIPMPPCQGVLQQDSCSS